MIYWWRNLPNWPFTLKKNKYSLSLGYGGRGGGVMVSVFDFYFDDLSSNPADN